MHLGRKFTNVTAKARGRTPLQYQFELIPHYVGEVPAGVDRLLFAWERGSKVFVTDAEPVNHKSHSVFWKQYLKQTATMYATPTGVEPKDYAFKIQSVTEGPKGEERKTIGKLHVDLAQFCDGQTHPESKDVFLQLKPHGKLKISIKAAFIKDARFDDAMTEVSGSRNNWASQSQRMEDDDDEQDLTGFDHANSETASFSGFSTASHHRNGTPKTIAEEGEEGADGEVPRRKKKSKRRKNKDLNDPNRPRLPNEIPGGFEVPMDPEERARIEEEQEYEREARKRQEKEYNAMVAEITAQVRSDMLAKEEGGDAPRQGFMAIFCCCLPRRPKLLTHEELSLLSKQQAVQMAQSNRL